MKTKFIVSVNDSDYEPLVEFEVPFKIELGSQVLKTFSNSKGTVELNCTVNGYLYNADENKLVMYAIAVVQDYERERLRS